MGRTIKLGLIGCGIIARRKFESAIRQLDNVELVAGCDIIRDKAEEMQRDGIIKRVYTDYKEMLAKENIDGVIVATPHPFHAELVVAAAEAGKHVLVEKPMAVNLNEIDTMLDAVKKANVKFVPLPFIYSRPLKRCIEMINAGCIGEIVGIEGRSMGNIPPPLAWYFSKKAGVGAFADIGIYALSTMLALFGEVNKVCAICSSTTSTIATGGVFYPLEQEDSTHMLLKFKSGKVGSFNCGWAHGIGVSSVTVYGREGILVLDGWENNTLLYLPSDKEKKVEAIRTVEHLGRNYYVIDDTPSHGKPVLEYFVECIKNDSDLTSDLKLQRHIMNVIMSGYESSRIGTFTAV